MTIFDLVTSQAVAEYWTGLQSNTIPFLGTALFPNKKKLGLDLSWIVGADSLPVALAPSAFDAKPTLRGRIGVTKLETEMPFFREAMRIGEKERQQILQYQENATNPFAQALIQKIYDDAAQLVDGANVQAERMRMSILIDGTIAITAGNPNSGNFANYTYNYDPDGSWTANNTATLTGTNVWSATDTATPVQDLLEIKRDMAKQYGVTLRNAILTTQTWAYLIANKSIKLDMNPLGAQNIILTDAVLQQYLEAKTGIRFVIYDKYFKDVDGTEKQFYPDGYVTMIPDGALGSTWYGTTPEEADLMAGNVDASVTIVNTGVAVLTKKESLPVNLITSVSQIALPSFEKMKSVFTLKVTA